jgi:hypothetical protein
MKIRSAPHERLINFSSPQRNENAGGHEPPATSKPDDLLCSVLLSPV